jgi:hypothetical protein
MSCILFLYLRMKLVLRKVNAPRAKVEQKKGLPFTDNPSTIFLPKPIYFLTRVCC